MQFAEVLMKIVKFEYFASVFNLGHKWTYLTGPGRNVFISIRIHFQ